MEEYNKNERSDFNEMPNNEGAYQNTNNYQTPATPPKNYLVESILITVLCCLPLGIVGIINATKVESLFAAGDYESAQRAADEAKKWCKWGLIGGIAGGLLYAIFMGVMFAIGAMQ